MELCRSSCNAPHHVRPRRGCHRCRLPDRIADRSRRVRLGLPRARAQPRPPCRAEDAAAGAGGRRAVPRALPARVAPRGRARAPGHPPDLCGRRGGRRGLPRHALRRRHRPQPADRERRPARARARARPARAGRGRARRRAPPRSRPPRRQAGEHPRRRDGPRLPGRLRPREARGVREQPHARFALRRDDRLHRARAGARRGDRRSDRCLLARLCPVRDAHGRAAVPPRERAGVRARPFERPAAGHRHSA